MSNLNAFYIQYQVVNSASSGNYSNPSHGIATIIVFADIEQTARSRARRIIASKKLNITDFLRIHLVQKSHIKTLDNILRSLYKQAELYGIAIHYDLFPASTSCLNIKNDQPD